MSAGKVTRQRTEEEEFDRLMIDFAVNPGAPRCRGARRALMSGVRKAGVRKGRRGRRGRGVRDVEYSKLPPEPVPELELPTAVGKANSVYLIDSENSRLRHLMQILPVPGDGNCFWAAFASAYHGDKTQWARVKLQTLSYFRAVKSNVKHPRHQLYQSLDNMAGQDGSSVENQLVGPNVWTSAETTQMVADLFNVELVMIYKLPDNPQAGVIFRGPHNRQQVFLYLKNVHWVGLRPVGMFPSDFRWEHHATRVDCRAHVMEPNGSFEVPRALLPCPRIPEVLVRDVEKLLGAADKSEV